MTAPTLARVSNLVEEYKRRTPTSAKLAERAAQVLPGGITHDSRFLTPYPIYVERASGSRKWDVDGNEYVDYTGGHGALLLGHNDPRVIEAVERQLSCGTHLGASHELEIRWAEWVERLVPSAELVRFTSSGTEATLLALRLARGATGRKKILRFCGHFHGWHDHMAFGVSAPFDGTPTSGVLDEIAQNVVLAPPNDSARLAEIFQQHDDIAAAIIEPTGGSWGQTPVTIEFLKALRDETTRAGTVLIFDEVITGFRCSPGGAQAALGITPDLTTLAKILAGGLPGGAVAGRRDLMEQLAYGSAASRATGKIPHHGTFNANPISAAAGIATLEIVATTGACEKANAYAARLRTALEQVLAEESIPWVVYGTFSGFHIFTNPQGLSITADDIASGRYGYETIKSPPRIGLLPKVRVGMMTHGVEIFSWPGGPTSAAHTDDDLERTVSAFRNTLRALREEGDID